MTLEEIENLLEEIQDVQTLLYKNNFDDDTLEEIINNYTDVKHEINEQYKPALSALTACIEMCKNKMSIYPKRKLPKGKFVQPKPEIQIENFDLIPRKWLTVDWSAVNIAFRQHKTNLKIPGLKVI